MCRQDDNQATEPNHGGNADDDRSSHDVGHFSMDRTRRQLSDGATLLRQEITVVVDELAFCETSPVECRARILVGRR